MRKQEIFSSLISFSNQFKERPFAVRLSKGSLPIAEGIGGKKGISEALTEIKSIYEEAVGHVEQEAADAGYADDLLKLQRELYMELEDLISYCKNDTRHHILLVIPVADRPLMLKGCLDSLVEHCAHFRYGGMTVDAEGRSVFKKISVLIIDDSRDMKNIQGIRELTTGLRSSGIRASYFGLSEQAEFISRIPFEYRERLSGLIGAYSGPVPPHKGASVTRNIAYIYIHSLLAASGEKTLIYFLDSDEEFRTKIKRGSSSEDIQFINFFYWTERIFSSSDIEVLTGKIAGDPPVSPSVMINTLLDDMIFFLDAVSGSDINDRCGFHEGNSSEGSQAEYHDMVGLFGYKAPLSPRRYVCCLPGDHTIKDCLKDFSMRAAGFFYGLHPTRTLYYKHTGDFTKTANARTVYTGNYVLNAKGLRNFIPFAGLKLRMAGPVLGRLLKIKLKSGFVSANLPLLHRRTIPDSRVKEFRSGLFMTDDLIDLSVEFNRQFWGDIMLFSIDSLTASGYPEKTPRLSEIEKTVYEVRDRIWTLYREQKAETVQKVSSIREYLMHTSLRKDNTSGNIIENLRSFCALVESNFGPDSKGLKLISDQIKDGTHTEMIVNAIRSFHEDELCWNELLRTMSLPSP
ncbi:MAG: hypothetical protein AB1632_03080 [Nitrospirota bacterium]